MSAETPPTAPVPAAAPKKSRKKLLLIVAAMLVLGAGGAGAAWYFTQGTPGGKDKQAQAPKKEPAKKPLFAPLDPFTVNLQDARGERFAQIGVTLQLDDPDIEIQLKDRLPAVRNQILLLIASKSIDELLTAEGKQQLAGQIRTGVAKVIGVELAVPAAAGASAPQGSNKPAPENPIKDVLFSQFIVQ